MLHQHPPDDRESYTVVETKVGNTTVTSYYTVRNRQGRESADVELDEQFAPPVFGVGLVSDSVQWLTVSTTGFRTLKYLWIVLGANSLYLAAAMFIPVTGLLTYQYLRQKDDRAGQALVLWRALLVLLGGLV